MLPVDVALGRLGMPIIRIHPDGTPERLERDFPKAFAARLKSDREIAAYVAKAYREVPKGWYPDKERLLMSAAEQPDDEVAAWPRGHAVLEELVPTFRFDLLPDDLRLMGYQMWQRRRLAGIAPLDGPGLVFGYWDDAMSAYDVPGPSFRGLGASFLAIRIAIARDHCLAGVAAECSGAGMESAVAWPYGHLRGCIVGAVLLGDPLGPGDPDLRSVCGGLVAMYKELRAKPGAVWSSLPVRERGEGLLRFDKVAFRYLPDRSVVPGVTFPDDVVPGAVVPAERLGWVGDFVSA